MNIKAALAVGMVFVGCCSNVVFLELVVKEDPGAGNLATFLQFLFIATIGFCTVGKFGTAKRNIPFKQYLILVGFFWTSSVANNYAFDFNISMPLHMIFRAGSLMANMAMGVWILKKKYSFLKYLSIFMISAGTAICTIQSSGDVKAPRETHEDAEEEERLKFIDWLWWCLGIAILTFALFVSARMGIFQESLYAKHGKHPWEALYYTHLLPLVFWLPTASNLVGHVKLATETPMVEFVGFILPRQVLWLILYVLTQGLCISAVYVLTTESASLTVTLTVTLRKFVSLLFSIVYFRNPFTVGHWVGTFLVFLGTMIFTELLQKCVGLFLPAKDDKKKK
ncbi:UDP-xylose and UDP-N-acetylglucosamine transporter [Amyelois transitella]|uniref:UDP-xylose and UDP-N-acetylglucosamine transporter n=1 Tax=Amyelois transitella TaxID=680683 RepID=UPI00298FDBFD|nr:UDP-xylose and UDP-N-acetylglucosamine transporter [Amyelois transitella]XP_060803464.1 UDP-xylose and UDP-N-acetylglucosamine transporter [Amyelois transitella]